MKKPFGLMFASFVAMTVMPLAGCVGGGGVGGDTEEAVAKASKMTLTELEEASKNEMEASKETFKVVGLTSTLSKALKAFCEKYEWMEFEKNTYCNNSYKDYQLLTALEAADENYFADFALVQDARSLSDYLEAGITLNYVPSDYKDMGLPEKDTYPLKGIYFNKIFYANKKLKVNLYNIWQLSGSEDDKDHLSNLSFQSPVTEQINMSFLLSLLDPNNQDILKGAYKSYYGKEWAPSDKYATCGDEFIAGFIANVSAWHKSDGTAMKETQVNEKPVEGKDPFIYYGAFAKMKDAAGKNYEIDGETVNAMTTVDWALNIEGFNGFMYTMYSQIVKNAKHPYTACLYARFLLTPECYQAMCYNESTPNSKGEASNMYGYYYPCTSTTVGINDNDWSKEEWIKKSIVEDYNFLKTIKGAQVQTILALVSSNGKA